MKKKLICCAVIFCFVLTLMSGCSSKQNGNAIGVQGEPNDNFNADDTSTPIEDNLADTETGKTSKTAEIDDKIVLDWDIELDLLNKYVGEIEGVGPKLFEFRNEDKENMIDVNVYCYKYLNADTFIVGIGYVNNNSVWIRSFPHKELSVYFFTEENQMQFIEISPDDIYLPPGASTVRYHVLSGFTKAPILFQAGNNLDKIDMTSNETIRIPSITINNAGINPDTGNIEAVVDLNVDISDAISLGYYKDFLDKATIKNITYVKEQEIVYGIMSVEVESSKYVYYSSIGLLEFQLLSENYEGVGMTRLDDVESITDTQLPANTKYEIKLRFDPTQFSKETGNVKLFIYDDQEDDQNAIMELPSYLAKNSFKIFD